MYTSKASTSLHSQGRPIFFPFSPSMQRSFFLCPKCGNDTRVTSINRRNPGEVRRYRKCTTCSHTFATTQPPETVADTRDWQLMPKGETHPHAKLTDAIVLKMREMRMNGETGLSIATYFDVEQSTAKKAIVGKTWKHVPMPSQNAPTQHQSL